MKVNWKPAGEITAEIEKQAMDRLETAASLVAARARMLVPVKSGKLRETVRVVRLTGDPKLNVRVYAGNRIKGGAFYAHMVEYGTMKMPAKPFLRPALQEVKGRVKSILEGGK